MTESFRISLPGGETFAAASDENLLNAAQRAHWLIRYGCRNGNCEACAAVLTAGVVEQSGRLIDAANFSDVAPSVLTGRSVSTAQSVSAANAPSILLCLAKARSDLQIELPGNPLHGSSEHAQRCYAQLRALRTLPGGGCELTFLLPAGKRLPVYPGQTVSIETVPCVRADVSPDALQGRELTVTCDVAPVLAIGARVHLRFPLGYAYQVFAAAQPLWLLFDATTATRAQRMQAWLHAAALFDMSQALRSWVSTTTPVRIFALAESEAVVRQWYAELVAGGIRFTELRSDFVILQPWRVCRQDDNGNRFVMAEFLDETTARAQAQSFTERGHKQLYWAEPLPT